MKANINDTPIIIRNIPRRYIRDNQVIDGYNLRTDLHEEDGWRDVIIPSYNTSTQKLGNLIIVNNTITYEVINLTQEEIDALNETILEEEAEIKMLEHIDKGIKLHKRSYRKIWSKVVKQENLTKAKGRKLFRWLKPTWEDLKNGDFRQASNTISNLLISNDTELQTEPVMLEVLQWFQVLIDDYKTSKYDL